jgi:predicted metal-dependent hydrolase
MDTALRAGLALYTAGDYHAAHEPWEETWLDLPDGDDKRLLHGLIQFTAAVYHARGRNWDGTVGLAGQAQRYITPLPTPYRGIDVDRVVTALEKLEADPEMIERGPAPPLHYQGRQLTAADLEIEGITTAAGVVATEYDAYETTIIERAVEYAREEATGSGSQFIGQLTAFVDDRDHRALIYDRLRRKVERRQAKREDVSGLFD